MNILQQLCNPPLYSEDLAWYKRPIIHCWNRSLMKPTPKISVSNCWILILYMFPSCLLMAVGSFIMGLAGLGFELSATVATTGCLIPSLIVVIGSIPLCIGQINNITLSYIKCGTTLLIWGLAGLLILPIMPIILLMSISGVVTFAGIIILAFGGWMTWWALYACGVLLILGIKPPSPGVFNVDTMSAA